MNNLRELLKHTASVSGESVYLEYSEENKCREVSFSAFEETVKLWSGGLQKSGVSKGDRVVFVSSKCPQQVYLFFAIWQLGAIAVPVSESIGNAETAFIIQDADCRLIVTDEAHSAKIASLELNKPNLTYTNIDKKNSSEIEPSGGLDDLAMLVYTSGSTGKPKGVMLSHRNLIVNALSTKDAMPFNDRDRVLSLLPYWHSFALIAEVLVPLFTRNRTVFVRSQKDFSRNLYRYKPTVILVVPRMLAAFRHLLDRKLDSSESKERLTAVLNNADAIFGDCPRHSTDLNKRIERDFFEQTMLKKINTFFGGGMRFFIGGGAPLSENMQHFYYAMGLPVYQGYGLTESSPVISCNYPGHYRFGSSGTILSWLKSENGGDYTFVDDEGRRGKELTGELLVKGDCVMQGYWNHSDSSAKTLVDGWLHTGDIARLEDGFLYICGRSTNLIVLKGGEKVHPEFIEDLSSKCHLIDEIMVFGEQCKNLYAFVNLTEAVASMTVEEVNRELQNYQKDLAPYQKTKNILVLPKFTVDDGTLTPTYKIRRSAVLTRYAVEIENFLIENNETALCVSSV